jgi:hypothetical protein
MSHSSRSKSVNYFFIILGISKFIYLVDLFHEANKYNLVASYLILDPIGLTNSDIFVETVNKIKGIVENLSYNNFAWGSKSGFIRYSSIYSPFMLSNQYDYDLLYCLFLGPEYLVSSTQPALGMVYKLMEINDNPCIKFSEEKGKQTIPGNKIIIRLFDSKIDNF